ncbi:MAG: PAS domain-containing protein [Pyrinomonadaceae bacterium]|nr:PAS domain-containing protein [Pyrinomonadaceae bacterium]
MKRREIRDLVESTADAAFSVDGMHNIEFWNDAAIEFFGIPAEEAIGTMCAEIIQGYDDCGKFCSADCCVFDAAYQGSKMRNFDLKVKAGDRSLWCNVSVMIAKVDGATMPSTIHIVREIDRRKRLEVLVKDFVADDTAAESTARSPVRETPLTEREREVLQSLSKGKTSAAIAKELSISRSTVNNHVQHILKKLNAHSRLEAIRRAEHAGLI